ncbi:APC family permease [Neobacillus cucumis]|uniref:APC family permease n=1 Tax=Neobacillus cucumis TaxID=1740721 RepID=UPI002E1E0E7B|nr:APC family permease [Neobacillus cucumis]
MSAEREMVVNSSSVHPESSLATTGELKREITWKDAFWFASGVPALVLFSIGAIASTVGNISWVVWVLSILMGFLQAFTYAEIAGMFPNKSGGASVYGAMAWIRYSKLIAPLSVWCNWVAWSPVLALGTQLASGYVLNSFFSHSPITTWQFTLLNLGWIKQGLSLRINVSFIISAAFLVLIFAIQHRGALSAARLQKVLAIAALLPLLLVGIIPLFIHGISFSNLFPLHPLSGSWDMKGWTLMFGGMFLAAWSTYGFETAVCYTSELKNPQKDTYKSIFASGLLCIVIFTMVPFAFQDTLGLKGLLDPDVASGAGVSKAMAHMLGGGVFIEGLFVLLLILSLVLAIMTAMAGSSRTLYQASVDGWFPKYLSHVNKNGAPTKAMWTDLTFNLILLLLSDYTFILAIANVNYIIFNFLNLNAGWIHRIDRSNWSRPYKVPKWLLVTNIIFAFVNLIFVGMGADIWGAGTLWTGLICAALIIPVFLFRHYVTDKGKFPEKMLKDMDMKNPSFVKRAGIWPYVTIIAAILFIVIAHEIAVYH